MVYKIFKEIQSTPSSWRISLIQRLFLAAIVCGGIFITHYRVAAFLGALLIAWLVIEVIGALFKKQTKETFWAIGILLILVAAVSFLITIPVWPGTIQSLLLPKLDWTLGKAELFEDFTWGYLTNGFGTILTLAGVGIVWGILQRQAFSIIFTLWIALMFLMANLKVFHLPGGGFINNASVEISLFMPISLFCGYLIAWILEGWHSLIPHRFHRFSISATSVALPMIWDYVELNPFSDSTGN